MTTEWALAYLSGMLDGEGTVYWKDTVRQVIIYSTTPELLDAVEECYSFLGVKFQRYRQSTQKGGEHWKPCYLTVISNKAGIQFLASHLTLRHPEKRDKLIGMANSYKHKAFYPTREQDARSKERSRSVGPDPYQS